MKKMKKHAIQASQCHLGHLGYLGCLRRDKWTVRIGSFSGPPVRAARLPSLEFAMDRVDGTGVDKGWIPMGEFLT